MKAKHFGLFPLFLLAVAGFGAITMLLWNALLPSIFGLVSINFWQALGLLVLARILFGGMGVGPMKHMHPHRSPIYDKWRKMTPEQRNEFIRNRRHFGFGHPFDRGHSDILPHAEAEKGNE
jgi:hypothetical protein